MEYGFLTKRITDNLPFVPGATQLKALELLEDFINNDSRYFILKGYAGTGKTTLLKCLIDALQDRGIFFTLCAPTGRAAKVISEKTGMRAGTIHRMIYSYANLQSYSNENGEDLSGYKFYFALRKNVDIHDSFIIVDESSMISANYNDGGYIRFGSGKLLVDLLKFVDPEANNNKIIFIGDYAQLPPVRSGVSAALSENYLRENFGITDITVTELTEVFRQEADSYILSNATRVRDSIKNEDFSSFSIRQNRGEVTSLDEKNFIEEYFKYVDEMLENLDDNIVITYSNKKAFHYNQIIRDKIFPAAKKKRIKKELIEEPVREIMPGDVLMITKNCYLTQEKRDDEGNLMYIPLDLYNGEFVRVLDVEPIEAEDRKNILVRSEDRNIYVNLTFRNIVICFKDYSGQEITLKIKILENFLNSPDPSLSMEQYKALFIEFKNRFIRDNLGKLEELRKKSRRYKDIEDTDLFKQAIKRDPYFNALLVKYGYAVTCHKAQGGEWKNVFVDFSGFAGLGSELFFRWAYTAITRAKERLYFMHAPEFSLDTYQERKTNYNVDYGMSLPPIAKVDSAISVLYPPDKPFLEEINIEIQNKIANNEVDIKKIEHLDNAERYFFTDESGEAVVDFKYDDNCRISDIEVFLTANYSKELAQKVMDLYYSDGDEHEPFLELESRLNFPKEKEFLKDLFYFLYERLASEKISIHTIEHRSSCERYYFKRDESIAVFDFYYDKNNNFSLVQEGKTNSPEFIDQIKEIINDGV